MRALAARVPLPLVALLAVALILGTAWSLVTPAFQAPDEPAHVGYAQSLAERFALPGGTERKTFSTEQSEAAAAVNSDQTAAIVLTKPEWSRAAQARWEAAKSDATRDDGGGSNPASPNPPTSYLLDAAAYRIVDGGNFFTRLWAMRMTSVIAFLFTVLGAWLLCGEVFARNRMLQVAAAGSVALAPMMGFLAGAVMPDSLIFALSAIALWLGTRVLRRGITLRDGLALGLVVGLAAATKSAALVLIPPAGLAVIVGAVRARRASGASVAGPVIASIAGLFATFGLWVVISRIIGRAATGQVAGTTAGATINPREFASYLWQFYLPKLPFQNQFVRNSDTIPVFEYWVKGTWANLGWLEVHFGDPVYYVLAGAMVLVFAMASVTLVRLWRSVDLWLLAFFALAIVTMLAGLHWTDYRQLQGGSGGFVQGRYLLPLAPVAGLLVALALRGLRPKARSIGVAVVLALLFTLNLFVFGLAVDRFYA